MPDPVSSASPRDRLWDAYSREDDDVLRETDASSGDDLFLDDEPSTVVASSGVGVEAESSAQPMFAVLRASPGELQHLNPAVARLLQPAFDELAESNGGRRLNVSKVSFVVKDLGGPPGHTVRDVVEISPDELNQPLSKQLYVVGHELAHVLQFEVIGAPGSDAEERWHLMEERYAAEARSAGRGNPYDLPADLSFSRLNVVDRRFTLESIAVCVGKESRGRYLDWVGGHAR